MPVVDADGDDVLAGFAFERLGGDLEVVVLAFGVGELADWIDVLPCACVDGVLGVRDGRGCIFRVEGDVNRTDARGAYALDLLLFGFQSADDRRRGVDVEAVVRAAPGLCDGASEATTLMR